MPPASLLKIDTRVHRCRIGTAHDAEHRRRVVQGVSTTAAPQAEILDPGENAPSAELDYDAMMAEYTRAMQLHEGSPHK